MTAPAGSEDAGLVLSAEETPYWLALCTCDDGPYVDTRKAGSPDCCGRCGFLTPGQAEAIAARVEAARAEERERIAAAIEEYAAPAKTAMDLGMNAGLSLAATVARITRGSQEARNGPVSAGDAGDGRGHGRDDESGRGAGL